MDTTPPKQPTGKGQKHHQFPTSEEVHSYLEKESDRGAILILGAYAEEALGRVIAQNCVSATAADKLLHSQAGGSFQARLTLAEAFGFLHPTEIQGLRILQKVRNTAAHFDRTGRGFDVLFDSPSTAEQVAELAVLFGYRTPAHQASTLRSLLINVVHHLVLTFYIRNSLVTSPLPAKSLAEIATTQYELYKHNIKPEDRATFENDLPDKLPFYTSIYLIGSSLQAVAEGRPLDDVNRMIRGGRDREST